MGLAYLLLGGIAGFLYAMWATESLKDLVERSLVVLVITVVSALFWPLVVAFFAIIFVLATLSEVS